MKNIQIDSNTIYQCRYKDFVNFLQVCSLYKNNQINRDKFLYLIRKTVVILKSHIFIKNDTKLKKLYHCKNTDTWFEETSWYEIINNIWAYRKENCISDLDLKDLINGLKLSTNKSDSICKNIAWDIIYELANLTIINRLYVFPFLSRYEIEDNTTGYCCEDCDGDIDAYISRRADEYLERELNYINFFK